MASSAFRRGRKTNIWGVFAGVVDEDVWKTWGVVKMGQVSSVENSWELRDEKVYFVLKDSAILDQTEWLI